MVCSKDIHLLLISCWSLVLCLFKRYSFGIDLILKCVLFFLKALNKNDTMPCCVNNTTVFFLLQPWLNFVYNIYTDALNELVTYSGKTCPNVFGTKKHGNFTHKKIAYRNIRTTFCAHNKSIHLMHNCSRGSRAVPFELIK